MVGKGGAQALFIYLFFGVCRVLGAVCVKCVAPLHGGTSNCCDVIEYSREFKNEAFANIIYKLSILRYLITESFLVFFFAHLKQTLWGFYLAVHFCLCILRKKTPLEMY